MKTQTRILWYCQWYLNNCWQNRLQFGATLFIVSFRAIVWSSHATHSLLPLHDKTKQPLAHRLRLCLLPCFCQRQNQNYSVTASCLKNILPKTFLWKANQKSILWTGENTLNKDKSIVFQNLSCGLLILVVTYLDFCP